MSTTAADENTRKTSDDRTILWAPGERGQWAEIRPDESRRDDEREEAAERFRDGRMHYVPTQAAFLAQAPEHLARPLLADWHPDVTWDIAHSLRPLGARFGAEVWDLSFSRTSWRRGASQDNGIEHWISWTLAPGMTVVVNLDPGIVVGYVDLNPVQTIERVWVGRAPGDHVPSLVIEGGFADMDPVLVSELLTDLTNLTVP
ncbi:hypothetical protein [Actinomadura formosensis]|uniref:hypothetical protein n=1 Tax=Actinomadura formosensis TaxID=60706 RepID=UPI003D915270